MTSKTSDHRQKALVVIMAMTTVVAMIAALAVWYVVVPHYECSHKPAA